jgi:hypothetical protein
MTQIAPEIRLTGPKGNNPLGFLTALGTLSALSHAPYAIRLRWDGVTPCICLTREGEPVSQTDLVSALFGRLRRARGMDSAISDQKKKEMDRAKTALKKKAEEIKNRKLSRAASKEARLTELEPVREEFLSRKSTYRGALRKSAADPSVTLGKNLTEANTDFLEFVDLASENCSAGSRREADLAAAYGVGDPNAPAEIMQGSPWALIRGDSRQNFLETIEQLMVRCTEQHLKQALFGPWSFADEKYSLRLDPSEDRRYALIDRDPTGTGNEPRTIWGANRIAFEALCFFPAIPIRGGTGVVAWREHTRVRWPLWTTFLSAPVIQSLLSVPALWLEKPAHSVALREMGVHAVMESRRNSIGKKFSMSPATPVFLG